MDRGTRQFARRILLIHLVLLVVLLTVVFAASWVIYRSATEQAFEHEKRQQSLLASQAASGLKGYYDSIFSDLELFKPINPDEEDTEDRIPEEETGSVASGLVGGGRFSTLRTLPQQLNGRVAHLFEVEKGTHHLHIYGRQATIPSVSELVERNRNWIDSLDKAAISPLEQFDDRQNDTVRSFTLIGVPVGPRKNYVLIATVSARATARRFFDEVSRQSNDTAAFVLDESRTITASSQPSLIGSRIGSTPSTATASAAAPGNAVLAPLATASDETTILLNKPFRIGAAEFVPSIVTAQPFTVLDRQWTVIITSPVADIDTVVRRIFRGAVLWAVFLALSMTAIIVSTAVQLIRNRARMDRERHDLLEKELRQAREIQLAWLPQKRPPGTALDIATANHPASRISGDFYNWFELPDGRTAVVIGDVTGHGMAAAFLMATTQLLVRNTLPQVIEPGRCLEEINRQLCTQVFNGQFVTLQILVLDPQNDRVEIATGGHPPPLLGEGGRFQPIPLEPNLVLGVERDSTYATETFDVSPRSTILLYTDGVLDAESATGDRFGSARLGQTLAGTFDSAQGVIDAVLAGVNRFTHGYPLGDDLTLVAVQVQSRPAAEAAKGDARHPAGATA
jgi:serine phosphatase RsbU (regulator of sigma subunit)